MTGTLSLSHHCVWGADNLFSSFKGMQMKKNFASGQFIGKVSIPDLNNLDHEIWVFWVIKI